jgi:hypothetical protein
MTDERLRELERRWKETGAVDDEARYLAERVRIGDLTNERLELAACCGHRAALLASPQSLEEPSWAGSAECALRAGLAIAYELLPAWEGASDFWSDGRAWGDDNEQAAARQCLRHALWALEEHVIRPTTEAARALTVALDFASVRVQRARDMWGYSHMAYWRPGWWIGDVAALALHGRDFDWMALANATTLECLAEPVQVTLQRTAVRDELVTWTLGRSDPVMDRLAARSRGTPR